MHLWLGPISPVRPSGLACSHSSCPPSPPPHPLPAASTYSSGLLDWSATGLPAHPTEGGEGHNRSYHLSSAHQMPGVLPVLFLTLMTALQLGTTSPILQMGKLKLNAVSNLPQETELFKWLT